MEKVTVQMLIERALEARTYSYSPYSGFQVGAALLARDGQVFTGCNIENAGYTPTNCVERTAFFKAVSEGVRDFAAIAVVAGPADTKGDLLMGAPCGVCLQVMMEFCDPETFQIIIAASPEKYEIFTLKEMLPRGFGPKDLGR